MQEHQERIINRIHELGIEELRSVQSLEVLGGDYINLECELPNGQTAKLLDDHKQYLACQVEKAGSDRCYGIAADGHQIAVYEYGCGGAHAQLVAWVRL